MQSYYPPLEPEKTYHIYNQGIDGENIFKEARNYDYFLKQYAKYLPPVIDTFAYCLLGNHFHLLARIKSEADRTVARTKQTPSNETHKILDPSRQFAHFFSSYTQSINKAYGRTGGLFQEPFKRKLVDDDQYFTNLIRYIHHNPRKHGFTDDIATYPYSSYRSHLSHKKTGLYREEVLDWFGDRQAYQQAHALEDDWQAIAAYIIEFE
jgi:REP element-mobilizing transposase RayT